MATKLKTIVTRALQIREKAGFTTETITKKRYKMAYIPDAIKQAAKELKGTEKPKRSKRLVKAKAIVPKKEKFDYKNRTHPKAKFKAGDVVDFIQETPKHVFENNPYTIVKSRFDWSNTNFGQFFYVISKKREVYCIRGQ